MGYEQPELEETESVDAGRPPPRSLRQGNLHPGPEQEP